MTQPRVPKSGIFETVKAVGKGFLGGVRGFIGGAVVGAFSGIARIFKTVDQIVKDSNSNDPKKKKRGDAAMAALILLPVALLPFVGALGVAAIALFTVGTVASVNAIYGAIRGAYEGARGEPFEKSMGKMFEEALPEPESSSIDRPVSNLDRSSSYTQLEETDTELDITRDRKSSVSPPVEDKRSPSVSSQTDSLTPVVPPAPNLSIDVNAPFTGIPPLEHKSPAILAQAPQSPTASILTPRLDAKQVAVQSQAASQHMVGNQRTTITPFYIDFNERSSYKFSNQVIATSWTRIVDSTPPDEKKQSIQSVPIKYEYTAPDKKPGEKKEISLYQSKIATEVVNDVATFTAMLHIWQEKHADKPPKISTHSGAEASWKAAFSAVYPGIALTNDILKIRDKPDPAPDHAASRRLSS